MVYYAFSYYISTLMRWNLEYFLSLSIASITYNGKYLYITLALPNYFSLSHLLLWACVYFNTYIHGIKCNIQVQIWLKLAIFSFRNFVKYLYKRGIYDIYSMQINTYNQVTLCQTISMQTNIIFQTSKLIFFWY